MQVPSSDIEQVTEKPYQMIESVPGRSLSNLFANVVSFYFPMQRSTDNNAFTRFWFEEPAAIPPLNDLQRVANTVIEFRTWIKVKYAIERAKGRLF